MLKYVAIIMVGLDTQTADAVHRAFLQLRARRPDWTFEPPQAEFMFASRVVGPDRIHQLRNRRGVVCGTVFPRSLSQGEVPPERPISDSLESTMVETRGASLVREVWGRYVAFLLDQEQHKCHVLRDPVGGAPCFYLRFRSAHVFFSHVSDVIQMGLLRPSVNWKYVIAFLTHSQLQISETGLTGVRELHAGQRLEIDHSGVREIFFWNPSKFVRDLRTEDFAEACALAEHTTKVCVGAYGSVYRTIMHRLSGGLDSTVVLAALAQSPKRPRIVCEHHYAPSAREGDERSFARLGASHAGVHIIETRLETESGSFERLLKAPALSKPSTAILSYQHAYFPSLVRAHSVDAYTSGQGGDHVFFMSLNGSNVADYVRHRGMRPSSLKLALSTAKWTRRPVWPIMGLAIRHGYLKRPYSELDALIDENFLAAPAKSEVSLNYLLHPWYYEISELPPGKASQIRMIVSLLSFQDHNVIRDSADCPVVLASQPLIELSLQLPTFVHMRDGVSRALERQAFIRDLPRAIANRRIKGAAIHYFDDVLAANAKFNRELLLDGNLVRNRIVDRDKLESALTPGRILEGIQVSRLLSCIAAEAWIRNCSALAAA